MKENILKNYLNIIRVTQDHINGVALKTYKFMLKYKMTKF